MSKFTVEEGIEVQAMQLIMWKGVLQEEVYRALEEFAKRENHLAKTGMDIRRGVDLDSYIFNYMLGHRL
jgi:hypothetical protein